MNARQADDPFPVPVFAAPVPGERICRLSDFGGSPDGASVNTAAFARAIERCAAGGGRVIVPRGHWLTGPIELHSGVHLHLEEGAEISFTTRFEDYLPAVFTRWEGHECYNFRPLIRSCGTRGVAITGSGVLDGSGAAWWPWTERQGAAQAALFKAGRDGVPVERRAFATEQDGLRPPFFQPIRCRDVLIEGVTFRNGPMWTIHPVYCDNVTVRGVTVLTEGPNTDGLNPDSCRNVLIEDCRFATGDDCIAINSGKNEDGRRVGRPCERIVVRRCRMERGHGGVVIGSGMSGDVRDVLVHDCAFEGTQRGIRLKSMRGRGGVVERIRYRDIAMRRIADEAVVIDLHYPDATVKPRADATPVFRDVRLSGVRCVGAGRAVLLRGLPEQPLENIVLADLRIEADEGLRCEHVIGLRRSNVDIRTPKTG
ncbi:MAG: hypothetical protein CMJ18_01495 [Phycisphaeraceae bacterium]|nr:hypothetical protein [Phycisphaeraceae bacterium]